VEIVEEMKANLKLKNNSDIILPDGKSIVQGEKMTLTLRDKRNEVS